VNNDKNNTKINIILGFHFLMLCASDTKLVLQLVGSSFTYFPKAQILL